MTSLARSLRALAGIVVASALSIPALAQNHLVISQVYGGGGNSGATLKNDFVELYNPTSAPVSLGGYSVQYASATQPAGSPFTGVTLLTGTAQPGKYYLVQEAQGSGGTTALPTPDDTGTIPMGSSGGKVALVQGTTALATSCPTAAQAVDFVGWGTANCSSNDSTGTTAAPATTNATSIALNSTNTWTGVNKTDYSTGTPNPRNSTNSGSGPATPPSLTAISTVQANRSTYVGSSVQVQGVVTLVTAAGFYLQTPSTTPGSTGDEGIYTYYGTGKVPAAVAVGAAVTVTGSLSLYPTAPSHTPALEISSATTSVTAVNQPLPAPIVLPAGTPTPGGGLYQLTRYESMLVSFPSLTVSGPTDGNLAESAETVTSNGQFYAVATGTPRPFREPGMDFRDFPLSTCPTVTNCTATATAAGVPRPSNLVLFDDNPERLIVESSLGGGTALNVSSGAIIPNPTGVLDFTYATDTPYGDPARLILQPGAVSPGAVTPGIGVQPLLAPIAGQVTVAAYNIERFYNTNAADNLYNNPATGKTSTTQAATLTADAYARRLKKVSLAIRNVLNTPDVVALEEAENKSVLQDIANQIDTDSTAAGQTPPHYVAYGTDNTSTFTNDGTGISVGFLVKPATVDVTNWQQIGANSTFTASTGTQTLNDRPSQVLHVGFKRAGASDYPVTLIVNHLRSLSGIATSADTRLKKELQAEMLATAIQGYQANGERVLAMGDFNAFEFSDGYTDTLGTATGNVSPAGTSVQPGKAIVSPAATDLVTLLPPAQRQSYTEFGEAQVLDHIVATSNIAGQTQLAYAHLDADFPLVDYSDATTPARTSDHDPAVAYLTLPAPVVHATLTGNGAFSTGVAVGSSSSGQQFVLANTGEAPIAISSVATTGDFSETNNCGAALALSASCQINVVFSPTAVGARTGTLTVTSNATIAAAALSGTGIVPATFTLTSGISSAALLRGASLQVPLTLTPTSTFSGAVTLSCTGLPANSSCSFGSSGTLNIAPGSGAQSITMTLRTAAQTASAKQAFSHPNTRLPGRLALACCLPGFLLAGLGARSRRLQASRLFLLGMAVVSLAATFGLAGCGSSSSPGTGNTAPAGSYTVTVVATGAGVTKTAAIPLTIQ